MVDLLAIGVSHALLALALLRLALRADVDRDPSPPEETASVEPAPGKPRNQPAARRAGRA